MTKNKFTITTDWLPNSSYDDIVEKYRAKISIYYDSLCLTAHTNTLKQRDEHSVLLSPYAMALWFASNWWRLRWEPTPEQPDTDWRMSHMLSAAGYGYCWPSLCFQADDQWMYLRSLPTHPRNGSSIGYGANLSRLLSPADFEECIDNFLATVLDTIKAQELRELWEAVQVERENTEYSIFRRLEAVLGYDPEEAPPTLMAEILELGKRIGLDSVRELGKVFKKDKNFMAQLQYLVSKRATHKANISHREELSSFLQQEQTKNLAPWQNGYALASKARANWGIQGALTSKMLCDIASLPPSFFDMSADTASPAPVGLAVRSDTNTVHFYLKKRHATTNRFMTARLICDCIAAPASDIVLPGTNEKTARQKMQRAFAAELLCPIEEIKSRAEGDYTDDNLTEVAAHFDVSPLAIKTHLINNNILPAEGCDNSCIWGVEQGECLLQEAVR